MHRPLDSSELGTRRAAYAAAALAALLSLLAGLGWLLGLPALRGLRVGETEMAALTALALLVTAASIVGALQGARAVARVGGGVVAAIGIAVLGEWLFGIEGGIAQHLLPAVERGPLKGRTSIPAALGFVLLGLSLLLVGRGRSPPRRAGDYFAAAAALLSFTVLTAYAYGATSFGPVLGAPATGMAMPTAAAMLACGLALLLVEPRRGLVSVLLSDAPGALLARRVVAIALLVPPAFGALITAGRDIGLRDVLGQLAVMTVATSTIAIVATFIAARGLGVSDARRRIAEDELRASEARSRMLFEHSADGVFFANRDGRYTDVNEAGCRTLRTTREQIVGRSIVDFIRPEEVPRLALDRERVLAGELVSSDWSMLRGDGTRVDVEVSTRMLPDGRWVGLVRDISARKAPEEELRRAHAEEHRLRRQLETISDATAAVSEAVMRLPQSDVRTVFHTVVLQAQAITGARYGALGIGTDPELPFEPWVSIGMPAEAAHAIGRSPRPRGLLGAVAIGGQTLRIDDTSTAPERGAFPAHHPVMRTLLGVPLRYRGKPVGNLYLSEKVDGTPFTADDQRAIEILADRVAIALETARLYEAEARERSWLHVTIDQMPEPVLIGDARGNVTYWNRAAAMLPQSDANGTPGPPFDLRRPTGEPLAREERPLYRASVLGELVTAMELILVSGSGRRVAVLASASPLPRDEAGEQGAVAVLQDITHQKELERLREEWTAIVAHDLRQPVAAISLSAQALKRRSLPADDAKLIERVHSSAERLRTMVEDLLDYAQIEAGRLRIAPRTVDVSALVAEIVERVAPSARAHPIRLEVHGEDAHAEVDPGRIDQVVTNLVSNAVKYGFEGTEVVVTIVQHRDELELTVTNRGEGLSHEELEQLFSRFYRTPTAVAAGIKGVGLGLVITKGIVEAHGGRIWAESSPHETTTFHVVLPVHPRRRAA